MNRPSNVPPSQQQPPPPNMSARHMHGHHNMRVPPPPLQQVGPPPHGLPLGFPPPAIPPNIQQQQQQQQRPNRAQNYHAFMESSNSSSFGGSSGGMPYLHYNRMGGVPANQASKKFHHSSGNKTRTSKFNQHPPEIRQQHHNQTLQQQQQHHGYTIPTQCLTEITTNSSTTSSSLTAISNLKIASNDTTRKPLPQTATTTAQKNQDIYASTSKKFPEISSRQFDVNFQSTSMANITPAVAVAASAPSAETKLDVVEDLSGLTSLKSLSLVDKLEDSTNISGNTTKDEPINTIIEEHEEKKSVVEQLKTDDTKEESPEESAKLEDTTETNDFKSSREKTPMCLVNDLARFNKISFQYRLTGENGPAHCKRFTVTLKLGDEEYVAEGHKIKEAQHLAAKEAILKTKYKNPIPKTNRRNDDQGSSRVNVTPTVELNALAMKLGLQTYYIFDPRQTAGNVSFDSKISVFANDKNLAGQRYRGVPPGLPPGVQNQLHGIGNVKYGGGGTFVPNLAHHNPALMHVQQAAVAAAGHHRGNFPHCYPVLPPHMVGAPQHHHAAATLFPTPCRITLIVGTQKFVGIGRTIQQAKHDAAAQAIEALKEEINSQQKENDDDKSEDADSKSPISLVFEIGIKRNLPVDFKILREDGPGHMRTFTTACIVGQIVTEAEGTGKKISKKKAAQKMLEELNKLPPVVTPTTTPTKKVKTKTAASRKTGGGNAYNKQGSADTQENSHSRGGGGGGGERVKKRSSDSESADASNPITKLLELFQHKKEKEPTFKLINEGGKERSRQRQFVVEVSSGDTTVRGVGNSKKTARRNAAQNFLMTLGLDLKEKPPTAVVKEHIEKANVTPKSTLTESTISKETTDQKKVEVVAAAVKELPKEEVSTSPSVKEVIKTVEKPAATSTTSSTGTSISSNTSSATTTTTTTTTTSKVSGLYMKDKLLYLAKLMGFEVDFSDYPKGNHNEFLSIVMISTNPPQICHGIGANAQESQEDAASNALKILSEMGLSK